MKKIADASDFQSMRDVLKGACTMNLSNKGVYAGDETGIAPAVSTAGAVAINGTIITVAASSAVFALEEASVPAYGGVGYVLCAHQASGSGVGYATNVLTSAQMSSASSVTGSTDPLNFMASEDVVWPTIPDTTCPVGIYVCTGQDSTHVAGSSTFSLATSDNATHTFYQKMNLTVIS